MKDQQICVKSFETGQFYSGKSKNEERTKKFEENKQNRTFQNQLIRPEIAALD